MRLAISSKWLTKIEDILTNIKDFTRIGIACEANYLGDLTIIIYKNNWDGKTIANLHNANQEPITLTICNSKIIKIIEARFTYPSVPF